MTNIVIDNSPTPFRERLYLWWRYECRLLRKVKNVWYWIRTHTYNRYHMLDIRNERNGYEWGRIDAQQKILFANFAMLVDFVEKEKGLVVIDWTWNEQHKAAAREIRDLYRWWKVDRKRQYDAFDGVADDAFGYDCLEETPELRIARDKCYEEEEKLKNTDTKNMIRLIQVARYLWT